MTFYSLSPATSDHRNSRRRWRCWFRWRHIFYILVLSMGMCFIVGSAIQLGWMSLAGHPWRLKYQTTLRMSNSDSSLHARTYTYQKNTHIYDLSLFLSHTHTTHIHLTTSLYFHHRHIRPIAQHTCNEATAAII